MQPQRHSALRSALIWLALTATILVPLGAAAMSPLLAWREPIYIASGFAGIIALTLLVLQPLLVAGYVPGLPALRGRRVHRGIGAILVLSIVVHVGGLWITSPPDVVDALLFRSPTPFSIWGIVAMWAVFASALLALYRSRFKLPVWRAAHAALAVVIVTGAIIHTVLIQGTMEPMSKIALCAIVFCVSAKVFHSRRSLAVFQRKKT